MGVVLPGQPRHPAMHLTSLKQQYQASTSKPKDLPSQTSGNTASITVTDTAATALPNPTVLVAGGGPSHQTAAASTLKSNVGVKRKHEKKPAETEN